MGWIGRMVRRQMGIEGLERDAAQVAARVNILARADEDRRRTQRPGDDGAPLARWRWSAGRWERWSFIEEGFVPDEPPQTLLDHVAATDGPAEGDTLRLVDGTWRADDDAREELPPDPAPPDDTAPTRAAVDAGRPTGEEGDVPPAAMGESATEQPPPAVDVAAQIEAWRRRST